MFMHVDKLFAAPALHVSAPMMLNLFHAASEFQQLGHLRRVTHMERQAGATGLPLMLFIRWASKGGGTVMLVGVNVVFAAFMHATPTKVGLVVGAGMFSEMIVAFEAVRAEVTFPK